MRIEVKEITPHELWRECAEMTTGKPCKMSWATALKNGHSLIRAQEWLIKLYDIPAFVMGHLVRHVHAQPYVLSKRTDRGGEDFRVECHDFGQSLDVLAEQIDTELTEEKAESLRIALGEMETEVKAWSSRFDRYAPTSMALKLNAEEIINISHARLCTKASKETREIWTAVVELIAEKDPDLAKHCVPMCIYRNGICGEPRSCRYYDTAKGDHDLFFYKKLFE